MALLHISETLLESTKKFLSSLPGAGKATATPCPVDTGEGISGSATFIPPGGG